MKLMSLETFFEINIIVGYIGLLIIMILILKRMDEL